MRSGSENRKRRLRVTADEIVARPAQVIDAAPIARIYNQGIAGRMATFETALQTEALVAARLRETPARYPAVVVEVEAQVVAFAWASIYRPRPCYEGVAEFSVYVGRDFRGRGYGTRALGGLIVEAERHGLWKLVSRIFPENTGSRQLCASTGFREVGTYRRHGKLDGQWRDCVIVERLIGKAAGGT